MSWNIGNPLFNSWLIFLERKWCFALSSRLNRLYWGIKKWVSWDFCRQSTKNPRHCWKQWSRSPKCQSESFGHVTQEWRKAVLIWYEQNFSSSFGYFILSCSRRYFSSLRQPFLLKKIYILGTFSIVLNM